MKKVLFSLALLLAASLTFAQEKVVKQAKRIANATTPNFAEAETLIIGSGITKLGTHAFQICNHLQNIDFGPTLQEIGDDVFIHNPFTSLFIPKNVVSISPYIPWDQNEFITNKVISSA